MLTEIENELLPRLAEKEMNTEYEAEEMDNDQTTFELQLPEKRCLIGS